MTSVGLPKATVLGVRIRWRLFPGVLRRHVRGRARPAVGLGPARHVKPADGEAARSRTGQASARARKIPVTTRAAEMMAMMRGPPTQDACR